MNLWFLLWFILSAILLGATGWSTVILFQQKKAWRKYAKARGLTYDNGTMFGPCTMEGVMGDYNLSFFTAVQQQQDERKNRQLTVMQLTANTPFVNAVAMGTKEMVPFLRTLDVLTPHEVQSSKWNKKDTIRSHNKRAVNTYLTEERIELLSQILSMPNSDILIILDNQEGIFRFETSNPLKNAKQIDNVVNKLIARVKKLQPGIEEQNRLLSMQAMGDDGIASSGVVNNLPDEVNKMAGGLELELDDEMQDAIEEKSDALEEEEKEEEIKKEIQIEYINNEDKTKPPSQ